MAMQTSDSFILILGLGISGLAMARWCAARGQRVRVADTRAQPAALPTLQAELPQVEFVSGPLTAALLTDALGHVVARAVYCSPGLAPQAVAPVRDAAQQAGVFFGGELDLFSQALAALRQEYGYQPQVLAITGTNGKTTVTALTGHLLERAGMRVAVAGNIGPSLLDTLAHHMQVAQAALASDAHAEEETTDQAAQQIDAQPEDASGEPTAPQPPIVHPFVQHMPQAWVLELSSFQLEYSSGFEPTAAVLLNITQDHLDWHGDMASYTAAKAKVYGRRAIAVVNQDDPACLALQTQLAATPDAKPARGSKASPRRILAFGLSLPQAEDAWGVETVAGMPWLARSVTDAQESGKKRRDAAVDVFLQRLMPADAMRIRGSHNISNALAALALASTTGAPLAPMLHGLREYRGEPHRVQSLGMVGGIEYIEDSKGTNVGATVAALRGLGGVRKLVPILGGVGKDQDFTPLAQPVQAFARGVVVFGRDAAQIEAALASTGVPLVRADSLQQAVAAATALAREGDAVLFSPACASFDMFDNYVHRAECFAACVQALALDAGQSLEAWA